MLSVLGQGDGSNRHDEGQEWDNGRKNEERELKGMLEEGVRDIQGQGRGKGKDCQGRISQAERLTQSGIGIESEARTATGVPLGW